MRSVATSGVENGQNSLIYGMPQKMPRAPLLFLKKVNDRAVRVKFPRLVAIPTGLFLLPVLALRRISLYEPCSKRDKIPFTVSYMDTLTLAFPVTNTFQQVCRARLGTEWQQLVRFTFTVTQQ